MSEKQQISQHMVDAVQQALKLSQEALASGKDIKVTSAGAIIYGALSAKALGKTEDEAVEFFRHSYRIADVQAVQERMKRGVN